MGVGEALGLAEVEALGLADGDAEGLALGEAEPLGLAEGGALALADRLALGDALELPDGEGLDERLGAMATSRPVPFGRAAKNRGGRLKVGTSSQNGACGSSAK